MKTWHWTALLILTVISLVAEFSGGRPHGPWARIPGFFILFGFAGCALIIIISKAIGRYLLQRGEDYYDEP